jgi:hypothetical protein
MFLPKFAYAFATRSSWICSVMECAKQSATSLFVRGYAVQFSTDDFRCETLHKADIYVEPQIPPFQYLRNKPCMSDEVGHFQHLH